MLAQIEGAIRGGIDLVQIRERDLEGGALARLVRDALYMAEGSATRILVNDRIDVALATGAGVHLRESSVGCTIVRRLWPAMTIGRSVHSVESVARAVDADYLIAGTIFPTDSKRDAVLLGPDGLARIVRHAGGRPVLAIGGVTIAQLPAIAGAGAQGIAAIGAFMPDRSAQNVTEAVEKRVKRTRFAFDTISTVT